MQSSASENGEQQPSRGAVIVLATLAVIGALYLGRVFLVPVCLALVLTALLVPVVAWLRRHHLPEPVGAGLTVLASLALLIGAGAALVPPLRALASDIPKSITAARTRLARYEEPLARIGIRLQSAQPGGARGNGRNRAARPGATPGGDSTRRDSTTRGDSTARRDSTSPRDSTNRAPAANPSSDSSGHPAGPAASASRSSANGSSSGPSSGAPSGVLSAVERTFGVTAELLSELIEVLLLSVFLLAGLRTWGAKLARAVRDDARRDATRVAVREMRDAVARYVLVTAFINVGQAILVALAMWGLGIPSPLLWGVLTFVLEFVPYLGGFVMVALLLLAGLASGGGLLHALLAPLSYLAITSIQNNLVSPALYGRGLRLNPTAVLVSVMFWYAMWGVAGAFLAVPILAAARILTTHVRALEPVGAFIEE